MKTTMEILKHTNRFVFGIFCAEYLFENRNCRETIVLTLGFICISLLITRKLINKKIAEYEK